MSARCYKWMAECEMACCQKFRDDDGFVYHHPRHHHHHHQILLLIIICFHVHHVSPLSFPSVTHMTEYVTISPLMKPGHWLRFSLVFHPRCLPGRRMPFAACHCGKSKKLIVQPCKNWRFSENMEILVEGAVLHEILFRMYPFHWDHLLWLGSRHSAAWACQNKIQSVHLAGSTQASCPVLKCLLHVEAKSWMWNARSNRVLHTSDRNYQSERYSSASSLVNLHTRYINTYIYNIYIYISVCVLYDHFAKGLRSPQVYAWFVDSNPKNCVRYLFDIHVYDSWSTGFLWIHNIVIPPWLY